MPRPAALLTSPARIPSPHEPPTVHFCSAFISHPLPSAQPTFPPSSRAVTPLSTAFLPRAKPRSTPICAASPLSAAFTPNRPLTPLSTAFTPTHRRVGGCLRSFPPLVTRHSPLSSPLCFHILTNCFSRNAFVFTTIRIAPECHPPAPPIRTVLRLCALCVSAVSCVFSFSCGLFISLAALFQAPVLCFQSFAHSSTKTPGVWVPRMVGVSGVPKFPVPQSAPLPNVTRKPVDINSSLAFNPGRGSLRYRSLIVICQLSQFFSFVAAVASN
jgi:hypothetical protein